MLSIENINIKGMKVDVNSIVKLLADIPVVWVSRKLKEDAIVFDKVDGRYYKSNVKNIIPLEADDPRVKKLGRDYLESERLTKEQWDALENGLFSYLQTMGVSYDLTLTEFPEDPLSKIYYVKQGEVVKTFDAPTSFPKKKVG